MRRKPLTVAGAVIAAIATVGLSSTASAYVGPGAGLGLLGALWGVLAAILATLAFVILWPFRRRLLRRRRGNAQHRQQAEGAAKDETS